MKKNLLSPVITLGVMILLLLNLTSSCMLADGIKGNGNVVTEERSVSGFDGIEVGGAFDIYITQGNTEALG